MSALTIRLIEAQARKLTAESRRLRNQADHCPTERVAQFLRRRSWSLVGKSREILEMLGK